MKRFLLLVFLLVWSGCSTAPNKVDQGVLSPEMESSFEARMYKNLQHQYGLLESKTKLKTDFLKIEKFIQNLVNTLAVSASAPSSSTIKVKIIDSRRLIHGAGLNGSIYLSTGLLKAIKFENELAFVLATQIALLEARHPQISFETIQGRALAESKVYLPMGLSADAGTSEALPTVDGKWFEKGGFFDFGNAAYYQADRSAIQRLVEHRYDPRGGISYLSRLSESNRNFAREPVGQILPPLSERIDELRNEVAKQSPLRNPIVKSAGFELFLRIVNQTDATGKNKNS
ncbi:MAG TPA: M48 family metalloprotease [Oligoflexia bacterium]|nr:M48 family metalloprotease [Oligoflexia bacterium]